MTKYKPTKYKPTKCKTTGKGGSEWLGSKGRVDIDIETAYEEPLRMPLLSSFIGLHPS
jgi:hypothetical protein